MKVLELFAGSCIFSITAQKRNHETFTIDIIDNENIDLVKDILKLEKSDIPFYPDLIWCSPPCRTFSLASCHIHWNADGTPKTQDCLKGLKILDKTLEVLSWFPQSVYYIENPMGKMRLNIRGLDRRHINYCKYGLDVMKPTDIWSNNFYDMFNYYGWQPRPECSRKNSQCHHIKVPRGSGKGTTAMNRNYYRSILPAQLCIEVIKATEKKFNYEKKSFV